MSVDVAEQTPVESGASSKKFGTFLGVFTPSILTILGVMMYLRFGWVLGNTGLLRALLIVLMASGITFLTALSASAISTNMRVGIGGEYFMISRSLGLELGGAIGIPLFLCRALSLTLYAFGLAECFAFFWPAAWGTVPVQWIATITILLITAIAGKSAELTLKLQLPIMLAVGLSLLALFGGALTGGLHAPELGANYQRSAPAGFWYVFAVFFPAVTGFAAGIGMSGDLKDPKRSIPIGTLAAVLCGAVIYLLILFVLAVTGKVTGAELATLDPNKPPIWTNIAWFGPWLVFPGMIGAILSSAFGSALGAPRVLQALSMDGLAPRFLSRTSKTGQPTIATWISGAIALLAVLLGDLNAVGKWVTIFFLTMYVTINLAASLESLVGDPSYRPTIRVPWYITFLGALGTMAVIFMISPTAFLGALLLEFVLYIYLGSKMLEAHWGDVRAGLLTALGRIVMLKLHQTRNRPRNWRPNILTFTAEPEKNLPLVRMANWFNQNRGIVSVCQVIEGRLENIDFDPIRRQEEIETAFAENGLHAFAEVDVVPELESGMIGIIQANGFAGLQSNIVMFGWPHSQESFVRVLNVMRAISRLHKNTVLLKLPEDDAPCDFRRIDIWWRGKQFNIELMLLFAYLLSINDEWFKARVRLRCIVENPEESEEMKKKLDELLFESRIQGDSEILHCNPDESNIALMHRVSQDADLVFLGLTIPQPGEEEAHVQQLETLASGFTRAVFVRNEGIFAGKML